MILWMKLKILKTLRNLATNVIGLGEVADFETETFNTALHLI
jgi:hypothetical protein